MAFFATAITSLWLIKTVKLVLFWVYLWQLKEYHIGRFRDHFRTDQGKQLLISKWQIIKYVLLLALIFSQSTLLVAAPALLVIYAFEVLLFIRQVILGRIKKPAFTFKTVLLTLVSFTVVLAYGSMIWRYSANSYWMITGLALFDVLLPLVISIVVLLFQPLFVLARLATLKKAAEKRAQFPHLKVIGITGSYGKTSTKEFLKTILSVKFRVLATDKHKNSEMGLAATILKELKPEHQIFIAEMGAYKKGGIKLLCDMVRPEIGVVTGINEQHLALFGSLDNLLSAEGGQELLAELPGHGLLVVNGDNKYCVELYKKAGVRKLIYSVAGTKVHSDIWAEEVVMARDHISFVALTREKHMTQFAVPVLGRQQVQNLLAAILIANDLGMSLEEISFACKSITQEHGGMTLKKGVHGIDIIDSSYSANPDGVVADLDYLSIFPGKKVIVMPCLIELGPKAVQAHFEIGKKIAQVCDMAIITTKDYFEQIKNGAMGEGMAGKNILLCDGPIQAKDIFHHISMSCKEGDTVLLEGRVPAELTRLLNGK